MRSYMLEDRMLLKSMAIFLSIVLCFYFLYVTNKERNQGHELQYTLQCSV